MSTQSADIVGRFLPSPDVVQAAGAEKAVADAAALAGDLLRERYVREKDASLALGLVRSAYYAVRPFLPVRVRRLLQRLALRGWESRPFPRWPVDASADELLTLALGAAMRAAGLSEAPFVWFWPEGARACVVLTHDVETAAGQAYVPRMIALEGEYGLRASYELVPEGRYAVDPGVVAAIREGGCEVCVHDLNHDGHLFRDRTTFLSRVARVNEHARRLGARGFRSAVMYRRAEWMDELAFDYDMSIPNVAHLDPQPGGCCTVFPFRLGHLVEVPLTMTQDYPLLHVLRRPDLRLWREQFELLAARHGLASFIVHPDYVRSGAGARLHRQQLEWLAGLREGDGLWFALPGEVERWWRHRSGLRLTRSRGRWAIEGEGAERACIGWARLEAGELVLEPEVSGR